MRVHLRVPQSEGALLALLARAGRILEKRYEGNEVELKAHIPPFLRGKVAAFMVQGSEQDHGIAGGGKAQGAFDGTGAGGSLDGGITGDPAGDGSAR
jgi:hypothetical protein